MSDEVLSEWIGVMEIIQSDSYQGFQSVSLAYDLRDARTRIAELESTEESMRCDIIDLSQKLSEANAKLAALRDSAPPPRGQGQGGKPCKQKSDNPAGKYINESV